MKKILRAKLVQFFDICKFYNKILQKNGHSVDFVYHNIADEANFSTSEELDPACAFIEIVGNGDDIFVCNEGAIFLPDDEVHRLGLSQQVLCSC